MSLLLAAREARSLDSLALGDEASELSWRDLDRELNKSVNALLAARINGRIAVFAPNSVGAALAFLTGLHAGVSGVPINFHLTAQEVAYILRDSNTSILFVSPLTARVGLQAAELAGIDLVVGWECGPDDGVVLWEEWIETGGEAEPPSDMPAKPYLLYSSGTTGKPKGIELPPGPFPAVNSVRDLFSAWKAAVEAEAEMLAGEPPGAQLVVGPLYHNGPLSSLRYLVGGYPLLLVRQFDAEKVLQAISRWRVQGMLMVPTHFQRLLALPENVRARYDLSSVRIVVHTGSACPVDTKRRMIDWFGPVFVEAYGGTESGTTNMIKSDEWLLHPGSVGKAVPRFVLRVIGEGGKVLGPNEAGQLYFRDTLGLGVVYHNDPAKTREAHIEPAVFTLGDYGYADEDGYVYITDRVADMVVSGGVNIYPAEIEAVLLQHPAIADCAVIGAPNEEMGEEVKALVILRDRARTPKVEELDQFCRSSLAGFKCPRSYEFVESVGRTAMGKINKRTLRAPYWPTGRTIGG